jgi:hypothetical protein
MTSSSSPVTLSPPPGRRRVARIYGTVVTGAVLAVGGDSLSTRQIAIALLVTLIVYWLAEQYAELVGARARDGHLPTTTEVLDSLAAAFPMVSASYLPLIVLGAVRLLGTSPEAAVDIALYAVIMLLMVHGWTAGRVSGLGGVRLFAVTIIAGILGATLVGLKAALPHLDPGA